MFMVKFKHSFYFLSLNMSATEEEGGGVAIESYLVAGCVLSMCGSVIDNWGMNIQKYAHALQKNLPEDQQTIYYVDPRWLLGFGIYIAGQILNLVSLGLIDQPTQSILSSFALFSNILFAKYYFNEKMSQRDLLGLFFISGGASLFVVYFIHRKQDITIQMLEKQFYQPEFLLLILFLGLIVGLCLMYIRRNTGPNLSRSKALKLFQQDQSALAYATLAAIVGGCTVTFSKIATVMIQFVISPDFNLMESKFMLLMLVIWVCFLVTSVHTLNMGLRNSPALVMIPIFYVLSNMTSILVGTIYFEEYDTFEYPKLTFICLFGVCMTLTGIWMLSQRVAKIKERDLGARDQTSSPMIGVSGRTNSRFSAHSFA